MGYKVTYKVKTVENNHGEFSEKQTIRKNTYYTISNDLNELFTDFFDKHRYEGLIAIEIL